MIGNNPTNNTDALQAEPFHYNLKDLEGLKSYLGTMKWTGSLLMKTSRLTREHLTLTHGY